MSFSILEAAREAPDAPALVADGTVMTFAQVATGVEAKLSALLDRDRRVPFPLVCAPTLSSIETLYACFEARVPVALLHPRLPAAELEALERQVTGFRVGSDALVVAFTSGTSSVPKGVELSRSAMATAAAASAERLGWRAADRWLLSLSYAHIGGLSILTRCLLARRTLVLAAPAPRFSPAGFVETLRRDEVTLCSLVPAQLAQVMALELRPPVGLRAVLVGGAAATSDLLARASELGWPVLATYGLTETCSQVATQSIVQRGEPGCGPPLAGIEIRIVEGRVQVRSPGLFTAYHPPLLFSSPLTTDGWLDTGDLGEVGKNGHLRVLGRADEIIVTGGEKVVPARVEEMLVRCPGIAQAGVFSIPDATWGALVAAALVSTGATPPPEKIQSEIAQRLAPHERPRRIAFLQKLPLGPTGKLRRRELAAACEGLLRPLHYG